MPECYLIAVAHGSSLDRDSNNWSLFNLIETIETIEENQPPVLPFEIHTFWFLEPYEYDKLYEFRFVFTTQDGDETSKQKFEVKSSKARMRIRIRGFEILKFGRGKLHVEWKHKNGKKWNRSSVYWPMEISHSSTQPSS